MVEVLAYSVAVEDSVSVWVVQHAGFISACVPGVFTGSGTWLLSMWQVDKEEIKGERCRSVELSLR